MIHKKGKSLTVGKYLVHRREGKEKGKGKYLAPKEERDKIPSYHNANYAQIDTNNHITRSIIARPKLDLKLHESWQSLIQATYDNE